MRRESGVRAVGRAPFLLREGQDVDAGGTALDDLVARLIAVFGADRLERSTAVRTTRGNSDVGAGLTFADVACWDYDHIPAGHVALYKGWGLPEGREIVVPVAAFRAALAARQAPLWRRVITTASVRSGDSPAPARPVPESGRARRRRRLEPAPAQGRAAPR